MDEVTVIKDSNGKPMPRWCFLDRMTPLERTIHDAAMEVERMPAHTLLTDASILLYQARKKISDYIEEVGE